MNLRKTLNNLGNPAMKWLLRSPLHGFASARFLLIEVTGRKSGKVYVTPVMYAQQGDTLCITTSVNYTWWRNLRGGAAVQVWLRGRRVGGMATTSTEEADVLHHLAAVYPRTTEEQRRSLAAKGLVAVGVRV
jgi:deazaflavin-dependent oxidoreductase (nitroreductase family)